MKIDLYCQHFSPLNVLFQQYTDYHHWLSTPTPPNAQIINTRSSQNTYSGVHIQSPGLLQLTALRCVRQSYPKSSVRPERRCSASHWSRTTRSYLAGFAAVALAASSETRWLYKLACFVFLSLSGHAPPYLADDIHLVSKSHRRRLRSSTDRSCAVPCTHNTLISATGASLSPGHVFRTVFRPTCATSTLHTAVSDVNSKRFCFNVASGAQWDFC